jgi:hypothetical protein
MNVMSRESEMAQKNAFRIKKPSVLLNPTAGSRRPDWRRTGKRR